MERISSYPGDDIGKAAHEKATEGHVGGRIIGVAEDSPAYDAGFEPGCMITSVDGQPLRDIIDWRWLSAGEEMTVGYVDLDGDEGEVDLWREPDEEWGFEFDGLVFDRVRQCRNSCTFCFMHQLPRGMRKSLYLRDDDYRLSFLVGTFVTLTNMTPEDEARIIEQRISPLRVSLQVTNPHVRERLIGKHAQHGLESLERLLAAGIEFRAQIVLLPGENDGDILRESLEWAYERPGILDVGIVPLGYTRHQSRFDHSFNDQAASRALLDLIEPFQKRAMEERGSSWVFAADEFYRNAYRDDLLKHLPPTSFYGDFSMFEDGIGIIRSTVDDWNEAARNGSITRATTLLRKKNLTAHLVAGTAQKEFLDPLIAASQIADHFHPLYIQNDYFGGNVDVTGLLTAQDITPAIKKTMNASPKGEAFEPSTMQSASERGYGGERFRSSEDQQAPTPMRARTSEPPYPRSEADGQVEKIFLIPAVVFNDDNLTLDDKTLQDIKNQTGAKLHMVSCSPLDYFEEIARIAQDMR